MSRFSSSELIFVNGTLFTGETIPTRRGAVAVSNGLITAIGTDDEIREQAGGKATIVDLAGGLLSPGFRDSHIHAVFGGIGLGQCDLHEADTMDECFSIIAAYRKDHSSLPWITGGGWSMDAFSDGSPTAALLDTVCPDIPAFLPNRDEHTAWVNSKALELAGLDADTPDPVDGRIERDSAGNPSGALHEGAMALVSRLLPTPSQEDYDRGLLDAQDYLFSLGVTGWQDALIGRYMSHADHLETYRSADARGTLKAHVVGALWWDRNRGLEQIPELVARRALTEGGRFRATSVKMMLDGVAETFTAAMTAPYLDACGHSTGNVGLSFIEKETLLNAVAALDALGFQVHFHALGDQAVRDGLDAIEFARKQNGPSDNRHHLAHLQVVHPDDLPRFAALDAVANIQPLWASHVPHMDEFTLPFISTERAAWQFPFGSLSRAGARLCVGSDWSVSTPNPLFGMYTAVTRRTAPATKENASMPAFYPDQAIDLATVWRAYTEGSAFTSHLDHLTGKLAVGSFADFAVLDRDPFAGGPTEITDAQVVQSYVEGEVVYSAPQH